MQKPGLEKMWQLVGTGVHYQWTTIAQQATRAIASTALALPILCLVASNRVAAQIKPDTTLPRNSIVTPQGNIIKIDGGTQAGSNLFHSFSQFSVLTGGTAFFNNAAGISNIFSRVTGGVVSNIDGILKANGTANLFLINPNGIIFGPNARLNIGGSFAATTANAIQFGTQGVFSASVPNDPSLLTVNPSAFLFNQIAAQGRNSIENQGFLAVNQGRSLLLVGGKISPNSTATGNILVDGTIQGILQASGGRIEVGGLAAPGTIGLSIDANNPALMSLSFPNGVERADVSLVNTAFLNVSAGGGGSIAINARNFNVSDGSTVQAGIAYNFKAVDVLAGDITIDATKLITVDNSTISNSVFSKVTGNGGNVTIDAGSLSLTNGGRVAANIFGQGNGGSVNITASDLVSVDSVNGLLSSILTNVEVGGRGNAGNINITTGSLSITNGGLLEARTRGQGNGGNINITAKNNISFDGIDGGWTSGAYASVESGAVGNGGNLTITGRTLSVTNGAVLDASTYGQGNAGNLTISAIDGISFDGIGGGSISGAYARVESGAVGNGGNLTIAGRTIKVTNGAILDASTFGQGNSGNLTISAIDGISFDGERKDGGPSGAFSQVNSGAVGNGGNLNITGSTVSVANGAVLNASTSGQGNGGNLTIDAGSLLLTNGGRVEDSIFGQGKGGSVNITASDLVSVDGVNGLPSSILSNVEVGGRGNAGNINITTGSLSITNGGLLEARTRGQGNGGNINITAKNNISFDGIGGGWISGAYASVESGAVGNGGNLTIAGRTLKVTNGAALNASTSGHGNSGNLTISALDGISFDGEDKDGHASNASSQVNPRAVGNGGNLNITGSTIKVTNGAFLSANTFGQGNAGNLTISARDGISFDGEDKEGHSSNASSQVNPGVVGNGGNLNITGRTIKVTNGAFLSASTFGQGNAGNLTISAIDGISFDGERKDGYPSSAFSEVAPGAVGNGGNLTISGRTLSVTNGAELSASTFGQGNAGNLTISAIDGISFDGEGKDGRPSGAYSIVESGAVGNGGNLNIAGRTLSVTNGAQLNASTYGQGNSGNLTISAIDGISFDGESKEGNSSGAFSQVESGAVGNGGNLNIAGRTISVTNGALLDVSTFGQGNSGNLTISAIDGISFDGEGKNGLPSHAFTEVQPEAVGNGGNLTIAGRTISVTNSAVLSTSTLGHGNAGNLTISAIDGISFDGEGKNGGHSAAVTEVTPDAVGNGGNLTITGRTLSVTNSAGLSASTRGKGDAGNININVNTFNAAGGSTVKTSTSTNNRAGDININAASQLTLSDSDTGIFASTNGNASFRNYNSTGNGGNLSITTSQLTIRNGAQVTAQSTGKGNAGDILNIQANSLTLDNGSITTTSPGGNGGNINNIQVRDLLLLRNNSRISTSAGTQSSGGGNGGNITINAPFIVAPAVENSKIIANAFQGNGGNIQINSQSLFGIKYSSSLTTESDINASSKFGQSGIVQINTPTVNPTQGLLALPTQVVDASTMIAKNCSESVGDNQFIITGRGGLPPNPDEVLSSDTVWEDTHSSATTANQQRIPAATTTKASAATARIISPATGWVFNDKGEIMLVATAPASSFYNPWLNATTCLGE